MQNVKLQEGISSVQSLVEVKLNVSAMDIGLGLSG